MERKDEERKHFEFETRSFQVCKWFSFFKFDIITSRIFSHFQPRAKDLRYMSSTLILYKELSSTIFQSLSVSESVSNASVTPVQIFILLNI